MGTCMVFYNKKQHSINAQNKIFVTTYKCTNTFSIYLHVLRYFVPYDSRPIMAISYRKIFFLLTDLSIIRCNSLSNFGKKNQSLMCGAICDKEQNIKMALLHFYFFPRTKNISWYNDFTCNFIFTFIHHSTIKYIQTKTDNFSHQKVRKLFWK